MDLFSQLVSIILTGIGATLLGLFITHSLAALLRNSFQWGRLNLTWNPTGRLDAAGFQSTRRAPNLNASDMAQGLYRD